MDYYLKNREEIIKKNVERQKHSINYKEYQKKYYLKNKKMKKKMTHIELLLKDFEIRKKRRERYLKNKEQKENEEYLKEGKIKHERFLVI